VKWVCRNCGHETEARQLSTRKYVHEPIAEWDRWSSWRVRRWQCVECNKRFNTVEMMDD
jgi:transcriptional regulator NrdR family protein